MVVDAHARPVGKHDHSAFVLSTHAQRGQFRLHLSLYQRSVLLVRSTQGTLSSRARPDHDFPQRWQAHRHAQLPFDQLPNQAQCPQSKVKAQLIWCATPDSPRNPAHLLLIELERSARTLFRQKSVLPRLHVGRQPATHGTRTHKKIGNLFERESRPRHFDGLHSVLPLFHAAQDENRLEWDIFIHALILNY